MSDSSTPTGSTATIPPKGGADLTELEPEGRGNRTKVLVAVVAVVAIVAAALLVWRPWSSGESSKYSAADAPLRVFASVTPHAEILRYVNDELAEGEFSLQVIEETDGVNGNDVVENGDADVSYFQHVPYLESDTGDKGYTDLEVGATVHVEPYGLYSDKATSLDQVPDGGLVLLSNNVSNVARGLYLLQEAGLITLPYQFGDTSPEALKITEADIVSNPKNLKFRQVEPAQIPRSLPDAALGLINGNVALEAGLKPAEDALLLEKAAGNPYANILTVPTALESDPRVTRLEEILEGPEVAAFIDKTYPGSVIPVAGGN
ncbi:MetQ/NlpA family ABC transporter substrate-binding protein [Oryzobacter terrae]|uniref:MetQ/NlpA family ABC transporter substrate-binding protein n=1 Tax=Oryzobacter terrae TaxID=1620385 RepID=UPI00366C8092